MLDLFARLSGGDRRSIGEADAVAALARDDATLFAMLVEGMEHGDPVVRMRCADAAEKASRARPERLVPHAARLTALARRDLGQEARWHLAQMLPRLPHDAARRREVERILANWTGDESRIVQVCALQGLADIARDDPAMRPRLRALIETLADSGPPSVRARARKLRASLAG
jgi:hypothetical protein